MNNTLKRANELAKSEKYKMAIALLEKAERLPLIHPEIYVRIAMYIQLSGDDVKYELRDVERFLKKALTIDDKYVNALIELGDFYYVENEPIKAEKLLTKAIKILKWQLNDTIITLAKCIEEKQSKREATKFLEQIGNNLLDYRKIEKLKHEFKNN